MAEAIGKKIQDEITVRARMMGVNIPDEIEDDEGEEEVGEERTKDDYLAILSRQRAELATRN